jgi:uncharacterized protein YbcI
MAMPLKTKAEIESAINDELPRFLKKHFGEEPAAISTEVIDEAIIVRLKGLLPPAEKHLSGELGGAALIHQLKTKLTEKVRPDLASLVETVSGASVIDVHSSLDVAKEERVEVFTLNQKIRT